MSRDALAGRVVLVTGAARGIGAALARRLARHGARLALVGLEGDRLAALAAELGAGHAWAEADVTRDDALVRAVERMVATLGRLDVVVANAGIASHGTVATTPMAAHRRVVDVNLTGVIGTVHATLAHLKAARGHYLLLSSAAAFAPMPGLATYAATKAAVEQFGNALRMELAPDGVTVGTAHPIWIDTEMVRGPRTDLPSFEAALGRLPPPFGTVVPLDACAAALERAVLRRARRVFVPSSLAPFAMVRALLASRFAERLMLARTRDTLAAMEREVRVLGRSFAAHTVGIALPGDEPPR